MVKGSRGCQKSEIGPAYKGFLTQLKSLPESRVETVNPVAKAPKRGDIAAQRPGNAHVAA
jgi:hypothetical protein